MKILHTNFYKFCGILNFESIQFLMLAIPTECFDTNFTAIPIASLNVIIFIYFKKCPQLLNKCFKNASASYFLKENRISKCLIFAEWR